MTGARLLILDNALDHDIYRPVEHWSEAAGFAPDHIHVPAGEPLAPVGDYSHVIVSGSESSIVERAGWAEQERFWVQKAVERGTRILGSCWGHQLIALALGGPSCVRRARLPEIGWIRIEVLDSGGILPVGWIRSFASHFDEVIANSHPDLRILARSALCDVQALQWGTLPVWGIQAHPEMNREAARMLMKSIAGLRRPEAGDALRKARPAAVEKTGVMAAIVKRFLAA